MNDKQPSTSTQWQVIKLITHDIVAGVKGCNIDDASLEREFGVGALAGEGRWQETGER